MRLQELQTLPPEIKQWKNSTQNRRFLAMYLRKFGFEEAGSGTKGTVFYHPKRGMLKVFRTDRGYTKWVGYCKAHPENPYCVRFRSPIIKLRPEPEGLTDTFGIETFGILLEELTPLQTDEDIHWYNRINNYIYTAKPDPLIENDANLKAVLEFIMANGDDLTQDNLMKRGDQYVFSDPM